MPSFTLPTLLDLPRITPTSVLDILIVAFLVYQLIMLLRGRRSASVLIGLLVLSGVYLIALWLHLDLLRTLLATVAPYTPLALVVMFQSELRRALARIGRTQLLSGGRLQRREMVQEIVLAVTKLTENH